MTYDHFPVSPEDKFIEEAAEAIQAVLKAKRFGYYNWHPDRPHQTNMDELRHELDDLLEAMNVLEMHLRDIRFEQFKNQLIEEQK